MRSNDEVQKKLQKAFDQLNSPYFYERKRGEWGTLGNHRQRKYKDKETSFCRRLDIEYVGQAWRMVAGEPALSITQKRDLFDDEDIYSDVFHPRRSPQQFLVAALLRIKYEEFWHGNNLDGIRSTCGSYLTDPILRRMINVKGLVVAHSVALTCKALKKGENLELEDAKTGLKLLEDFETKLKPWNRLLAKAFHELLQAVEKDEESIGLKKSLEKSDGSALERLWASIEASASVFLLEENKSIRDILVLYK